MILLAFQDSKSHHTGIETVFWCYPVHVNKGSKSHHTGIETSNAKHIIAGRDNSKSHHTGIETVSLAHLLSIQSRSKSHHTGIETKFLHNQLRLRTFLQIAPYWNWNVCWSIVKNLILESPNRTILELKLVICSRQLRGWQLQIAPYWNWNEKTTIERNWWNRSPNRTILELKLKYLQTKAETGGTPNRTILELKRNPKRRRFCWLWNSKSHHTGIETALLLKSLRLNPNSKSHHTGIETL